MENILYMLVPDDPDDPDDPYDMNDQIKLKAQIEIHFQKAQHRTKNPGDKIVYLSEEYYASFKVGEESDLFEAMSPWLPNLPGWKKEKMTGQDLKNIVTKFLERKIDGKISGERSYFENGIKGLLEYYNEDGFKIRKDNKVIKHQFRRPFLQILSEDQYFAGIIVARVIAIIFKVNILTFSHQIGENGKYVELVQPMVITTDTETNYEEFKPLYQNDKPKKQLAIPYGTKYYKITPKLATETVFLFREQTIQENTVHNSYYIITGIN